MENKCRWVLRGPARPHNCSKPHAHRQRAFTNLNNDTFNFQVKTPLYFLTAVSEYWISFSLSFQMNCRVSKWDFILSWRNSFLQKRWNACSFIKHDLEIKFKTWHECSYPEYRSEAQKPRDLFIPQMSLASGDTFHVLDSY